MNMSLILQNIKVKMVVINGKTTSPSPDPSKTEQSSFLRLCGHVIHNNKYYMK